MSRNRGAGHRPLKEEMSDEEFLAVSDELTIQDAQRWKHPRVARRAQGFTSGKHSLVYKGYLPQTESPRFSVREYVNVVRSPVPRCASVYSDEREGQALALREPGPVLSRL